MNLPSGTVTFLFTDIEGSTKLWERYPDEMRTVLAKHDALLREAILTHGGVVFKTVGDGFYAAFDTASDALMAALAAQRVLIAEGMTGGLSLRVRMALHTGTVESRDEDYFGQPLNRAARLLAVGHGGQILLSNVTSDLTRDTLPSAASLKCLGEHRLRDLGRPETIFQLLHPALPSEFPHLRSLANDDLPNNLPQQVTSFVGRDREIADVKRLLGSTHLCTLTGSGGCGKTRLGLQVAADVLEDFPDGVWLVELAALTDSDLIAQAVAQTLAVREEPNVPVLQTLTRYLKEKRLLLILDNCEHLAAACAQLCNSLIRACAHLRILASSREPLDIAGELSYRVPPLSLPDRKTTPTVESLKQCESVRLFVERATFVQSDFRVTNSNSLAVAQLCRDLDGLPLAIELAAACVRNISVEQIAARLDDRFRLLRRGNRTALPRQQTLRALIDWSYDLLDAQEKTLFARTSVFAGGWTMEAMEAVCADTQGAVETADLLPHPSGPGPLLATLREQEAPPPSRPTTPEASAAHVLATRTTPEASAAHVLATRTTPEASAARVADAIHASLAPDDVLDLLANLVNKSLVVYEPQEQSARYRLLETVRQYAAEKLTESGNAQVIQRRHQDYFLALAEKAEMQFDGSQAGQWLDCLEADHDNLRLVTQRWLEDADGARSALRLTGALWRFWYLRGYWSESNNWMTRALEKGAVLPGDIRVKALTGVANIARRRGDLATAQSSFEECLAILGSAAASPAVQRGIASTLQDLALVARDRGKPDEALSLLEQSLEIRKAVGDKTGVADASIWLGYMARDRQDYSTARALFEQSLVIYQAGNSDLKTVYALHSLGLVAQEKGDDAAAHSYYERSLAIRQKLGDRAGEAETLTNLGNMAFAQGDGAAARSAHERSLTIRQELGDAQGKADSLCNLGWALLLLKDYSEAVTHLQDSLRLYREFDNKWVIPECLEGLAGAASGQGKNARAARLLGAAHALRQTLQAQPLTRGQQIENEKRITTVRAALGADAFAEQWANGAAMTIEEATGYGLEAASA